MAINNNNEKGMSLYNESIWIILYRVVLYMGFIGVFRK